MHNSTNKILNNNSIKYFNGRDLNYEGGTLTLQQLSLTRILTPSLCWNLSFLDVNQLFRWFCHVLWQRRFPHRGIKGWRLTKTILNDHHTSNITKDYIVKTTRSLKAEWSSQNTLYNVQCTYVKVFRLLFDCIKIQEPLPWGSTSFLPLVTSSVIMVKDNFVC